MRYSLWLCGCFGIVLVAVLSVSAQAKTFELRGLGTLQSEGPFGIPGESITVTVTLDSEDFDYLLVANPGFRRKPLDLGSSSLVSRSQRFIRAPTKRQCALNSSDYSTFIRHN